MKLYITGSVGSGKSTLARKIAEITGIAATHLDEVLYIPCASAWGNTRRSDEEIDKIFYSVIHQNNYIMEDTGRECFIDGMKNADKIIVLDIPLLTRKYRIVRRWVRQNLGLEKCNYKPKAFVLKQMFRWLKNYDADRDGTKSRIKQFEAKAIYLKNQKEIDDFLAGLAANAAV